MSRYFFAMPKTTARDKEIEQIRSGELEPLEPELLAELTSIVSDAKKKVNPVSYREALELSIAKWHPSRGKDRGETEKDDEENCGLCAWFRAGDSQCGECPLVIKQSNARPICCFDLSHPWHNWFYSQEVSQKEAKRYAEKIYKIILNAYCDEVSR